MVSIFSFFNGKRKKRNTSRPSSPTSPPANARTRPASPTRPRSAPRFLSLRSRSSSQAYDLSRRSSVEQRKRRSLLPKKPEPAPQLTLSWEARAAEEGTHQEHGSLGLENVGRPPKLKDEEEKVLAEQTWDYEETLKGWRWFGQGLRTTGLDDAGIMLPMRMDGDRTTQRFLLALFTLSQRPNLAQSLPSVVSHFPPSKTQAGPELWHERLKLVMRETNSSTDFTEILKTLLHRTKPPSFRTTAGGEQIKTVQLEQDLYQKFVTAELGAGYPMDAYSKSLAPMLSADLYNLLDEVFEVWAAIVARGDVNRMGEGRLPLLLGWWLWDRQEASGSSGSWKELYSLWQKLGRRTEHLFYAWIRYHSTIQKLPIRLLQLVQDYPFLDQSSSTDGLPSPPPSSFPRRTLLVRMITDTANRGAASPKSILKACVSASGQETRSTSLWSQLRSQYGETPGSSDLDILMAEDSQRFFAALPDPEPLKTKSNGTPTAPPKDDQLVYRPFSAFSPGVSSNNVSRRRSRSFNEYQDDNDESRVEAVKPAPLVSPLESLSQEVEALRLRSSPTKLNRRPSESVIQRSAGVDGSKLWASFESSGFGDRPAPNLQLSPRIRAPPSSPATNANGQMNGFERPIYPQRRVVTKPDPTYTIEGEETVNLDDLFMSFVEDGQLDPGVQSWPSFALLRLKMPISHGDPSKPIDWLLISLQCRPPVIIPDAPEPRRSMSPSGFSTTSRFGSSMGLFRRASSSFSLNAARRSIFSSSQRPINKRGPSTPALNALNEDHPEQKQGEMAPAVTPPSAVSTAPTEYTITEMGEMIKVPSQDVPATSARLDPSLDTSVEDWTLNGQGGAHFVFAYRGIKPQYRGQILRIRKMRHELSADTARGDVWSQELLPRLLPADLLLSASTVQLQEPWLRTLLPVVPGSASQPFDNQQSNNGGIDAWIMEDLTAPASGKNGSVLCIEIKPKWGFLPSAEHVQPPEAANIKSKIPRFQLHDHLRDPTSSSSNRYNPLDLFSRDNVKVRAALLGLWENWETSGGKRNNWRIFMDGRAVPPKEKHNLPSLEGKKTVCEGIIDILVSSFGATKVLEHVRLLQSHLDATDISDVAARLTASASEEPPLGREASQEELVVFVEKYLSDPTAGATEESWTLRNRIIAYSLSAIFKDCSIMIKLPLAKAGISSWRVSSNPIVKIIDTDLKPISNFPKWVDLDERVWRNWLEHPPPDWTPAPSAPGDGALVTSGQGHVLHTNEGIQEGPSGLKVSGRAGSVDLDRQERSSAPSPSPYPEETVVPLAHDSRGVDESESGTEHAAHQDHVEPQKNSTSMGGVTGSVMAAATAVVTGAAGTMAALMAPPPESAQAHDKPGEDATHPEKEVAEISEGEPVVPGAFHEEAAPSPEVSVLPAPGASVEKVGLVSTPEDAEIQLPRKHEVTVEPSSSSTDPYPRSPGHDPTTSNPPTDRLALAEAEPPLSAAHEQPSIAKQDEGARQTSVERADTAPSPTPRNVERGETEAYEPHRAILPVPTEADNECMEPEAVGSSHEAVDRRLHSEDPSPSELQHEVAGDTDSDPIEIHDHASAVDEHKESEPQVDDPVAVKPPNVDVPAPSASHATMTDEARFQSLSTSTSLNVRTMEAFPTPPGGGPQEYDDRSEGPQPHDVIDTEPPSEQTHLLSSVNEASTAPYLEPQALSQATVTVGQEPIEAANTPEVQSPESHSVAEQPSPRNEEGLSTDTYAMSRVPSSPPLPPSFSLGVPISPSKIALPSSPPVPRDPNDIQPSGKTFHDSSTGNPFQMPITPPGHPESGKTIDVDESVPHGPADVTDHTTESHDQPTISRHLSESGPIEESMSHQADEGPVDDLSQTAGDRTFGSDEMSTLLHGPAGTEHLSDTPERGEAALTESSTLPTSAYTSTGLERVDSSAQEAQSSVAPSEFDEFQTPESHTTTLAPEDITLSHPPQSVSNQSYHESQEVLADDKIPTEAKTPVQPNPDARRSRESIRSRTSSGDNSRVAKLVQRFERDRTGSPA